MPTPKPKSVTIELTPKQQEKLRKLTGQTHSEIRAELSKGRTARTPLSAKAAPSILPPEGPPGPFGLPWA